jgi:hypothetical protein
METPQEFNHSSSFGVAQSLPSAPPSTKKQGFWNSPDSAETLLKIGAVLLNGGTLGEGLAQLGKGVTEWRSRLREDQQQAFDNEIKTKAIQAQMLNAMRLGRQQNQMLPADLMKSRQSLIAQIAMQDLDPQAKQQMWADAISNPAKYGLDPQIVQGLPAEYTPRMDAMGKSLGMSAYQLQNANRQETRDANTEDWRKFQKEKDSRDFNYNVTKDTWDAGIQIAEKDIRNPDGTPVNAASVFGGAAQLPPPPPSVAGSNVNVNSYGPMIEQAGLQAVPGVNVTSRERSVASNAKAGGVSNSFHLTDDARDFTPPSGMSMGQLTATLKQQFPGYDVINEGDHVHVEPGQGMAKSQRRAGGIPAPAATPAPGLPGPVRVNRPGGKPKQVITRVVNGVVSVKNPDDGQWYRVR